MMEKAVEKIEMKKTKRPRQKFEYIDFGGESMVRLYNEAGFDEKQVNEALKWAEEGYKKLKELKNEKVQEFFSKERFGDDEFRPRRIYLRKLKRLGDFVVSVDEMMGRPDRPNRVVLFYKRQDGAIVKMNIGRERYLTIAPPKKEEEKAKKTKKRAKKVSKKVEAKPEEVMGEEL